MTSGARSQEAQRRAEAALRRAAWAAQEAATQERLAREGSPESQDVCESLARVLRRSEGRHRAAAELQLAHARRLRLWEARTDPAPATVPSFLGGVGDVMGAEVAVTLFDSHDQAALMSASGPAARAAIELEYLLDEGPSYDCTTQGAMVSTSTPTALWPSYGRAVAELGITSVAATPLVAGSRRFGALACYNAPASSTGSGRPALATVADALAEGILGFTPTESAPGSWEALVTAAEDVAAPLHNASGVVSAQLGCDPATGLALIRARAFAMDEPVLEVARRVVAGELQLEW